MSEYKQALKRLTVGYIVAIFVACAAFTLPVLIVAQRRINEGARLVNNAPTTLEQRVGLTSPELRERIVAQAGEGQTRLLITTLIFDIILVSTGSVASYYFARKTLAPLEEAHKAQERFTADASHELRTPLAVIQTELEVALKAQKNRAELEKTVHGAIGEVHKLSLLTEKLLQLAKTDSPKAKKEIINVSAIVNETTKQLEHKYKIRISHHIEASLKLEANEILFRQLLEIIVDNAVKYSGKGDPKIRISLARTGERLLLEVADEGAGISKDDLPHVFDRLYRGTNASYQEGHGLGLALAKSIADLHQWQLKIASEVGKGTTVQVLLPTQAPLPL